MVIQINVVLMEPTQALVFMVSLRLATTPPAASLLAIGGAKIWVWTGCEPSLVILVSPDYFHYTTML